MYCISLTPEQKKYKHLLSETDLLTKRIATWEQMRDSVLPRDQHYEMCTEQINHFRQSLSEMYKEIFHLTNNSSFQIPL